MENTMEIYTQCCSTPQNALKPITAGRLKGMSDINPMYRIQKLTEVFGACGFGWKYTIVNKEIMDGANGEKVAIVDINLYVKWNDEWSEAIPGTGGASFIANERNGAYTSDEFYKMALTDALSVSCKALGIGADVYWAAGHTKYDAQRQTAQNRPQQPQAQPLTTTPQTQQNAAQPSVAQPTPRKRLMQLLEARNIDVQQYMAANNLSKTTPESEVERMIKELEQLPPVPSEIA